eukprot:365505-Pyramimonas_sp.AAC.1
MPRSPRMSEATTRRDFSGKRGQPSGSRRPNAQPRSLTTRSCPFASVHARRQLPLDPGCSAAVRP